MTRLRLALSVCLAMLLLVPATPASAQAYRINLGTPDCPEFINLPANISPAELKEVFSRCAPVLPGPGPSGSPSTSGPQGVSAGPIRDAGTLRQLVAGRTVRGAALPDFVNWQADVRNDGSVSISDASGWSARGAWFIDAGALCFRFRGLRLASGSDVTCKHLNRLENGTIEWIDTALGRNFMSIVSSIE